MPAVRELEIGETVLAAAALLELRPDFLDVERLTAAADAQRAEGYRVAGSFEDADPDGEAAAAAGFRLGSNLAWGRFLYVDDLATRPESRGRGHGRALMDWLLAAARAARCDELHLDSGQNPARYDAHRLYMNSGMHIHAHHFVVAL